MAAGLIFRGGKLLITQRRHRDHLGGLWEFPGGKREGTESFEDCLKRELREELGIEVKVGARIDTAQHCYPEKEVHLQFFLCQILKGEPRPLACPDLAWITQEDLSSFNFPEADQKLVEKLKQKKTFWKTADEHG